jgi:SAM-dependent methyltransferase
MSENLPVPGIDVTVPSVARMYDFYLGGKDNYAADREAAEQILQLMPDLPKGAQANRRFLAKAVRHLAADAGITQFLDLGAGLPTQENVHEVALSVNPGARIVYVDKDPVVCAHGRALTHAPHNVGVIQADLRDPETILEHETTRALLDFDQPIAIIMVAILHFVADSDGLPDIMARYRDALAPGSHLVISHGTEDLAGHLREEADQAKSIYDRTGNSVRLRSHREILDLFKGYELLGPGVTWLTHWDPDAPATPRPPAPTDQELGSGGRIPGYAGIGRKP